MDDMIMRRLLDALPAKAAIARVGAGMPPVLKTGLIPRVLWAVARRSTDTTLVTTNFGLSTRYAIATPTWAGATVLFGQPKHYRGERGALRLAAALSNRCSAFVDIGSHLGYFLFYLRHILGDDLPLYYFEANPDLYRQIDYNLKANRITNVTGFCAAIGDHEGEAAFHVDLDDLTSSSLEGFFAAKHHTKTITVPITTFARVCERDHLSNLCVKVDVEDAEFQFVDGAHSAFDRIRYLIMEVLGPAVKRGFHQLMIERYDWNAYYIDDHTLRHSPTGSFTYAPPELNWLYCREDPEHLQSTLERTGLRVASV